MWELLYTEVRAEEAHENTHKTEGGQWLETGARHQEQDEMFVFWMLLQTMWNLPILQKQTLQETV